MRSNCSSACVALTTLVIWLALHAAGGAARASAAGPGGSATTGAPASAEIPPAPGAGAAPAADTTDADTTVTTVILVRHAERNESWLGADPPLSAGGLSRADRLAHALGHAGVAAIYTTAFRRNRETAAPLARVLGDSLRLLEGSDFAAQAARIRREVRGRTGLVVGHSDTIPQLVMALTGKVVPPYRGGEFDRLYVVTLYPGGSKIVRLAYGDPSPEK